MAALVVPIVFALVVMAMRRPLREAIVVSAVLLGLFVATVTESLSLFAAISKQSILIAWLLPGLAALGVACRNWRNSLENKPYFNFAAPMEWVPILAVAFALTLTLSLVFLCPPNNFDVILYHLPRQVQWLQQGSIAHFPTQDYRLTINPPLAEYFGLHLMALAGTDRLNAVVSWCCFVLTIVAVSLLARELGLSRAGQWLAAACAATVPMGIHEAASGKNDGMVAFWFIAAIIGLVRIWKSDTTTKVGGSLFGGTIGLLMLTKGTGAVFVAPILLLAGFRILQRRPPGWRPAAGIALAIAVSLNAGHALRNSRTYGSFAGQTFGLANERHDPGAVASNIFRNVAMHAALPKEAWNGRVQQFVERRHAALGVSSDEPATTWGGQPFHLEHCPQKEHAAAPVHFLLIGICGIGSIIAARKLSVPWAIYWLTLCGASFAFCFAFKWQPWHARLHLPLFSLAAVGMGWLLSQPYIRVLSPLVIASLVGAALPALLASEYRSLTGSRGLNVFRHGSESLRFLGNSEVQRAAELLSTRLAPGESVDLINHASLPWEYPLTRRLKSGQNPRQVRYFYPVAGSPAASAPEAVIDISDPGSPAWIRHHSGRVYRLKEIVGPFALYRPWDEAVLDGAVLDHPVGRFGIGAEAPPQR